jgi:hypothetical protein
MRASAAQKQGLEEIAQFHQTLFSSPSSSFSDVISFSNELILFRNFSSMAYEWVGRVMQGGSRWTNMYGGSLYAALSYPR